MIAAAWWAIGLADAAMILGGFGLGVAVTALWRNRT